VHEIPSAPPAWSLSPEDIRERCRGPFLADARLPPRVEQRRVKLQERLCAELRDTMTVATRRGDAVALGAFSSALHRLKCGALTS
jgi:hypothetical protein